MHFSQKGVTKEKLPFLNSHPLPENQKMDADFKEQQKFHPSTVVNLNTGKPEKFPQDFILATH